MPDSTKEYEAEFKLGLTTDTLDVWGTVQSEKPVNATQQDIQNILPEFTGDILQLPPMYSAVQQDGKRLYELARQGIVVQREKRQVNISLLQLLEYNENTHTGKLRIACSKGTYIRTLIDDIGVRLNCGGIMTSLCRTKACGYTLNDAVTLEQAKQLGNEGALDSVLKDTSLLFNVYRQVKVSLPQAKRFCNGGQLDLSRLRISNLQDAEVLRVCTYEGRFIGLGKVEQEKSWLAIYKLFNFIHDGK